MALLHLGYIQFNRLGQLDLENGVVVADSDCCLAVHNVAGGQCHAYFLLFDAWVGNLSLGEVSYLVGRCCSPRRGIPLGEFGLVSDQPFRQLEFV